MWLKARNFNMAYQIKITGEEHTVPAEDLSSGLSTQVGSEPTKVHASVLPEDMYSIALITH